MENKNNEELNLYEMYIFEAEKDLCRNNGELCRRYKQFKGKVVRKVNMWLFSLGIIITIIVFCLIIVGDDK